MEQEEVEKHWGWCFWCGEPATHISTISKVYICQEHARQALSNGWSLVENPDCDLDHVFGILI